MCSISGFVAPFATQEFKFETLKRLLISGQSRGTDASGIAYIDPKNGLTVLKNGVSGKEFVETDEFLALEDKLPAIVIAHNRSASRGTANGADKNENNHPFISETSKIALIHNGFVDTEPWDRVVGEGRGILKKREGGTDSEILLRVLETFTERDGGDFFDNVDDMCYNVEGTYAVAIIKESHPNKLWLVKNTSPLEVAWVPEERAMLFASTQEIIKDSLKRVQRIFDFFNYVTEPYKAIHNSILDNFAVEVTTHTAKNAKQELSFRSVNIETPDKQYTKHKEALKEMGKKEEITNEENLESSQVED